MSIYDLSYIGTATNRITFNNYSDYPIYRVQSRQPQQRNIRDLDIPVPFESGISDFETLVGQVAYVIEGTMYPGSETDYNNGLAALRRLASLEVSQADNDADNGYVPYVFTEAVGTKQIFMKVLYVDAPENTRKGLVQPFRLVCKIKDPTIYGGTIKTASTQSIDPTNGDGAGIYPFSYPIVLGTSSGTVSATVTNSGDIPTYPLSIQMVGPANKPKLTNLTTGDYIEVNVNLATSSNVVIITYDKDSLAVEQDGISVISSVTSGSSYFKLPVGTSNLQYSATSLSDGAYVEVNYRDAYALS